MPKFMYWLLLRFPGSQALLKWKQNIFIYNLIFSDVKLLSTYETEKIN